MGNVEPLMKAPLPLMRSSATFATSSAVPGQHACMIWLTAQTASSAARRTPPHSTRSCPFSILRRMGSSPRTSGTRVMAVPAGEECSVPSAGRKPARCPHRHADQPVNSFQPRGGRRPRRPDDRRTSSYISNRQRQRRKGEADSKLRIRFTGNPACRPGRKSRNRRLLAHLL